jgi:hypothetical protein
MRGIQEVTPILDTYCSGLGAIEDLGTTVRFYLYVLQVSDAGVQERILVDKIVMPKSAVPDAILQAIAAIGGEVGHVLTLAGELVH